jgi:hypothetical protein
MAEDDDMRPVPQHDSESPSERPVAIGEDALLALTDEGRNALRLVSCWPEASV